MRNAKPLMLIPRRNGLSLPAVARVNVSLKLRKEVAELLALASFERTSRNVAGVRHQQEIVDQALENWLRKEGYWKASKLAAA